MLQIPSIFEPANNALQKREMHIGKAVQVVRSCLSVLEQKRQSGFDNILTKAKVKWQNICTKVSHPDFPRLKRIRQIPPSLKDFGVEESLNMTEDETILLKQIFNEASFDHTISET